MEKIIRFFLWVRVKFIVQITIPRTYKDALKGEAFQEKKVVLRADCNKSKTL